MRDLPALMPYLHLPVQSGSDRILDGDEPPAHARAIISTSSRGCARRAPTSPSPRISSSASPARPRRISRPRCGWSRGRLRRRLYLQIFAAARHAGRRHGRSGSRRTSKTERLHRAAGPDRAAAARFQRRASSASTLDVLLEKPGRLSGQMVGRSPYLQAVQVMAPPALIGRVVPVTITEVGTNSLFGALADAPARRLWPQQELRAAPCAHRTP